MQIKRLKFDQYPYLLKQIDDPPKFLDMAGGPLPPDDYKFLCVIGARRYSKYGEEVCKRLIKGLKGFPVVIVSGLAIGIDSIAHRAAMDNEIKTISFPGSGLNESSIYPHSHLNLARKIIQTGNTLLSPFEPEQQSKIWTFPVRNRLMAGISHATLIIEGKKGSGTLLTANYALGFNRDVFIVPGSIFSELSYGPHMLYKRGAIPITSSEEILEMLGFKVYKKEEEDDSEDYPESKQLSLMGTDLSSDEQKVLKVLQYSPLNSTDLIGRTGLSINEVNIILSTLEIKDLIYQDDDIYFAKN